MPPADPAASRAVLIGTHTFARLDPLPAVANNLHRLRATLTDPALWGSRPSTARCSNSRPTPMRCWTPCVRRPKRRGTRC